mgnify:CR=1 FL=1
MSRARDLANLGDGVSGSDITTGTLGNTVQDNITRLGAVTQGSISDGAIDFNIASHDGTNGLKLGGTLVTATASELNLIGGSNLSNNDTGKAVLLNSSGDIDLPSGKKLNAGLRNSSSYGGMVLSNKDDSVAGSGTITLSLDNGNNGGSFNGALGILTVSVWKTADTTHSTHSIYAVIWNDVHETSSVSTVVATQTGSGGGVTFSISISNGTITVTNTESVTCRMAITFIGGG